MIEASREEKKMVGCEIIGCADFKDGKCTNELDYVSKVNGSPMCPRNKNATPKKTRREKKQP